MHPEPGTPSESAADVAKGGATRVAGPTRFAPTLERLRTDIPGLDQVLAGGLVSGDGYLVAGAPGTGKSTLGNHLAHNVARAGSTVVFTTLLAEQHDRMLAHLGSFGFLDPSLVGQRVHYVSLYDPLLAGGLDAVLVQARALVRAHHAKLLVVDGSGQLGRHAASDTQLAQFVMGLKTQFASLGCTTVLISDEPDLGVTPQAKLLDGIILLYDQPSGARQVRVLEVVKLRGVNYLRGRHQFAIAAEGFQVYPRLEALDIPVESEVFEETKRVAFGVPGLDAMLGGGLIAGSSTLLLGAPGTGKTIAGLHLLVEGARRGERGLITTFHKTPANLIAKSDSIGLELGAHVASGHVRVLWRPPVEILVDAWVQELLANLDEHRPRRLFIEAITDLERMMVVPERIIPFITALTLQLRGRGITVLLTAEAPVVFGGQVAMPLPVLSTTIDNAILLRYVELRSQLHRLLSIVKVGQSAYDTSIREFAITDRGLEVAATFESAEAVLRDIARPPAPGIGHPGGRQVEAG